MDEETFQAIYLRNWNFPWTLYRDIFIYARDNRISMVGLNLDRHPTRTMVLMAGSGHVRNRSSIPLLVLLPQPPGILDVHRLSSAEADFLIIP